MEETVVLTFVTSLGKLNEVLASLQLEGMTIESITPLRNPATRYMANRLAFVVFRSPVKDGQDGMDILVWLEVEHGDDLVVY